VLLLIALALMVLAGAAVQIHILRRENKALQAKLDQLRDQDPIQLDRLTTRPCASSAGEQMKPRRSNATRSQPSSNWPSDASSAR
jgi:hypothetical protein